MAPNALCGVSNQMPQILSCATFRCHLAEYLNVAAGAKLTTWLWNHNTNYIPWWNTRCQCTEQPAVYLCLCDVICMWMLPCAA